MVEEFTRLLKLGEVENRVSKGDNRDVLIWMKSLVSFLMSTEDIRITEILTEAPTVAYPNTADLYGFLSPFDSKATYKIVGRNAQVLYSVDPMNLEGWNFDDYLIFHACSLCNLIFDNDEKKLPNKFLIRELWLTANAFRIYATYSKFVNTGNGHVDTDKLERYVVYLVDQIGLIFNTNENEVIIPCGSKGHATYLNLVCLSSGNGTTVALRVDNSQSSSGSPDVVPRIVRLLKFSEFYSADQLLKEYLKKVFLNIKENSTKEIYEYEAGKPKILPNWSILCPAQRANTCVVSSFRVGEICRATPRGIDLKKLASLNQVFAANPPDAVETPTEIYSQMIRDREETVKRRFVVGESNFKKIITNGSAIVDKSMLIASIIDGGKSFLNTLIVRPGRFGKSLNLSMIHSFFALKKNTLKKHQKSSERVKRYFESSKLWRKGEPYRKEFGMYPVIHFDFRELTSASYDEFLSECRELISEAYKKYEKDLPRSNDGILIPFCQRIIDCNSTQQELILSLRNLTEYLRKAYSQETIVLIDEYDKPITVCGDEYKEQVRALMRNILYKALKDNKYLKFSIITGTLGLDKGYIFYNVPSTFIGVSSNHLSEYFGFLEEDIREYFPLFNDADIEEIKRWYGGYSMGTQGVTVFNPWSVVNYYERKLRGDMESPVRFWATDVTGTQIKALIASFSGSEDKIKILLNDEVIEEPITEPQEDVIIHDGSQKGFWSFMFFNGYLTGDTKRKGGALSCKLKIPNEELKGFFSSIMPQKG